MKLYIYQNVEDLTDNYHSSGGLIVITNDEQPSYSRPQDSWEESSPMINVRLPEPALIIEVPDTTLPRVFVFPDSGCC